MFNGIRHACSWCAASKGEAEHSMVSYLHIKQKKKKKKKKRLSGYTPRGNLWIEGTVGEFELSGSEHRL